MEPNITQSNSILSSYPNTAAPHPWLMLVSRSLLFIIFQVVVMLVLAVSGSGALVD